MEIRRKMGIESDNEGMHNKVSLPSQVVSAWGCSLKFLAEAGSHMMRMSVSSLSLSLSLSFMSVSWGGARGHALGLPTVTRSEAHSHPKITL